MLLVQLWESEIFSLAEPLAFHDSCRCSSWCAQVFHFAIRFL